MYREQLDDLARQALRSGSEKISQYGWTKGKFGSEVKGYCAAGAASAAARELSADTCFTQQEVWYKANDFLSCYLFKEKLHPSGSIAAWNDDSRTTAEDVILGMKRAADEGSETVRSSVPLFYHTPSNSSIP